MRESGEMPIAPVIYRLTYYPLIASDVFYLNLPTAFREEPTLPSPDSIEGSLSRKSEPKCRVIKIGSSGFLVAQG
jgi:hypothetical protein